MDLSGTLEIEGQVEEQRGQGKPREDGGNDLICVTSAERRSECRERDSRHQQRFSRPQPPTPTGARTCDIHVRFVIVNDLTERQAEMVVQGELKHGSPFLAAGPLLRTASSAPRTPGQPPARSSCVVSCNTL